MKIKIIIEEDTPKYYKTSGGKMIKIKVGRWVRYKIHFDDDSCWYFDMPSITFMALESIGYREKYPKTFEFIKKAVE